MKSKPAKAGYVYLIRAETGQYKIGMSTRIGKRIRFFEIKLPFEIELVHSISCEDCAWTERQLHERYADKRIKGEWFALNADDVEEICRIAALNRRAAWNKLPAPLDEENPLMKIFRIAELAFSRN